MSFQAFTEKLKLKHANFLWQPWYLKGVSGCLSCKTLKIRIEVIFQKHRNIQFWRNSNEPFQELCLYESRAFKCCPTKAKTSGIVFSDNVFGVTKWNFTLKISLKTLKSFMENYKDKVPR